MNPYVNHLAGFGGGFIAYFPSIGDLVEEVISGGGGVGAKVKEIVGYDVLPRLFDEKEKLITPAQVLKQIPKKEVTEQVKEIKRRIDVMAPYARELIKMQIRKQIELAKKERLEQLNQEAISLILIAIAEDD